MKLNKSTEQAVYVVLILALELDHRPLKSTVLADILQVSDSYLKKILRKLVVGQVITSAASKDGGFQLQRPINSISLADVYSAVQTEAPLTFEHIGARLFTDIDHVKAGEQLIARTLEQAQKNFVATLTEISMAELLETYAIKNGAIAWEDFRSNVAKK
ncbi:RrF2 family transcriptional regulator [Loigolactobacillus binensis]|uniref:RrF2 family transcriptional regulator n=1 Tax=Loigolactobacillus binensis TaxID=2559922 RepID=A0ABW3EDE1_9LACO|nr:Rrf2 family transcriptional regulator [Loigolactobacillus binensis]